jgi:hypothetical protein
MTGEGPGISPQALRWQSFDTTAKDWADAPGDQCPAFNVVVADPDVNMGAALLPCHIRQASLCAGRMCPVAYIYYIFAGQYIERAIKDQEGSLNYAQDLLKPEQSKELKETLSGWTGAIGRAVTQLPTDMLSLVAPLPYVSDALCWGVQGFKAPEGAVRRHEFLQLKQQFYDDQTDLLLSNLTSRIMADETLPFPYGTHA